MGDSYMLSEGNKQFIIDEMLKKIWNISNSEYQLRIWVKGEGPEVDSFEETICQFYDACEEVLEKYEIYHLTRKQYEILLEFVNNLNVFLDSVSEIVHEEIEIIPNPKWHEIQQKALQVLAIFDYQAK